MKTKAEKMFADAGWEKQKDRLAYWKTNIYYSAKNGKEIKETKNCCISFLSMRLIHFYCINEGEDESEATPLDYINEIDMETLLAINQQCVELGWLIRRQ